MTGTGNLGRFSGFAGLYDAVRPSPPAALGPLLCSYAGREQPEVVDLGSGSGLSSRWAASWAASVVGVEPNDDMRAVAESHPAERVTYRKGTSEQTGLAAASADVVLAVQAFHWMDPEPTLAEAARILRPGGVMAAVDADWPPVTGSARAEAAWQDLDLRIERYEQRMAADGGGATPGGGAAPDGSGDGPTDRGAGVRSWDKAGHLARMVASGRFRFTREVVLHAESGGDAETGGGAERFVGLLRSQGSYQQLRRTGVDDAVLGLPDFEREVTKGFAERPVPIPLSFSWRVRLGVVA